jgi:hypothetical protein
MRRFALVVAAASSLLFRPAQALAQHDMAHMGSAALDLPMSRQGSGTSWLPDSSRQRMSAFSLGGWSGMLQGSAFGLNNQQQTLHGGAQWALLDWEMASATRQAAGGRLRLNAMTSAESFVLPDSGYHELLQTGEVFHGRRRADVQHPQQPLMELSAYYDRALSTSIGSFVYVAPVGEPALGPVVYMQRPSAEADPFAPIGHHWQDASHESVGVITAGFLTRTAQFEGSIFNAREPGDGRLGSDLRAAKLDSYSGRLTVLPTGRVALAAWAGYLADHDALTPGLGMQRYGASILTETRAPRGTSISTALIWGTNVHHHSERLHVHDSTSSPRLSHPTSGVLLESTWRASDRTWIYGRAEQVQKMADEFGFLGGDLAQLFTVRTISVGAARQLVTSRGLAAGMGIRAALNFVPATLEPTYQTTHAAGFVMYLMLQPAGSIKSGTSAGRTDSSR